MPNFLSIIVPCYNEETSILPFYNEAKIICESLKINHEIIFIDDGSKDNTLIKMRELQNTDSNVRYISFSRNFGKEAALIAGLQTAKGNYIVTMDVDGQDPPSLIPKMLEAVTKDGYDCAGTRRVNRSGEPPIRSFFAKCFYALMKKITDIEIVDGARDFRLMNEHYLKALLLLQEKNRFSKGIFPWIGFKIKWFEYENIERLTGKTKWSFWKLLLYSLDGITAFSSKPLAIASVTGILFFLVSLVMITFLVIRRIIWGDPVDGWASTVCIILFCSGIQLFTAGILGQYISKIYTETKNRPFYIIKETK
ncbi:MAG: glycosyltransferase family 2 protein [Treponema sp.]|nr:glycosyltransferase family 2 protein [Treponema sp.]